MGKTLIVEKGLSWSVTIYPEIQDVEAFFSPDSTDNQGFGEGVRCGHPDVLDKRIAEDADVGGGSEGGLAEIPVLSQAEIVMMQRMVRARIRMAGLTPGVRAGTPYPLSVSADVCFHQGCILWIEEAQGTLT